MAELSEDEFRRLLERKGLKLEGKAFRAAFDGARHLRAEIDRIARFMDEKRDEPA